MDTSVVDAHSSCTYRKTTISKIKEGMTKLEEGKNTKWCKQEYT